jgi:6-phosphogluconate dehydrogenase
MQLGMIGLGRMGANMVRRLLKAGHECVVYNRSPGPVEQMRKEGAIGASDLDDFISRLSKPRAVWLMVPAGVVDQQVDAIAERLEAGDIIIDGGNSYYKDDLERAKRLQARGIRYLDVGTSGGVWGLERGYCLMIGGDTSAVAHLDPLFASLAPGLGELARTNAREDQPGPAELGYLHCGPAGAGHFVKMVHNGIEYALMAAYAEGFNILKHAGVGKHSHEVDAETSPLSNPEHYPYEIDVAQVAELWRRGSVVASWLLDLTAAALQDDPDLAEFGGRVSDSGEGRWTSIAAIETGTPAPLLTTALYERFTSRDEATFANKILSAMRFQFGGHHEKPKS